jgi:hypothetical protein
MWKMELFWLTALWGGNGQGFIGHQENKHAFFLS